MTKAEALEILNNLDKRLLEVTPKLNLQIKAEELSAFNIQMSQAGFWDSPENAQKISKQASRLEHFITSWTQIQNTLSTLQEFVVESDEAGATSYGPAGCALPPRRSQESVRVDSPPSPKALSWMG